MTFIIQVIDISIIVSTVGAAAAHPSFRWIDLRLSSRWQSSLNCEMNVWLAIDGCDRYLGRNRAKKIKRDSFQAAIKHKTKTKLRHELLEIDEIQANNCSCVKYYNAFHFGRARDIKPNDGSLERKRWPARCVSETIARKVNKQTKA